MVSQYSGSHLALLQDFLHSAHILLFDLLTRDFGIPLARTQLAMPQKVANGHDLGPMFQEVRGKGMPQAMTTCRDTRRFGVALYLLLNCSGYNGFCGSCSTP